MKTVRYGTGFPSTVGPPWLGRDLESGTTPAEKPYVWAFELNSMNDAPGRDDPRGARMTTEEIDAFLTEQGVGLLALADGGDAYAIPISFGYDGERAVFSYWHFGTETHKEEYTEATRRACLAVYDVCSPVNWRSVLAFGELEEIPTERWGELGELIDDNAWSPEVSPIGNRGLTITGYEMVFEEVTGFQGSAHD